MGQHIDAASLGNPSGLPAASSRPSPAATGAASELRPPSISLPKGGGAIRSIGETFAANPVTGTGSLTVPIAVSPGRAGATPQLSLSYDSGNGNGPFGFGWHLSLPAISRKTDKGLPQYLDAIDSDTFLLAGMEDLVPAYEKDATGQWLVKDGQHVVHDKPRTVEGVSYQVRRYLPRVEGAFSRIERWTRSTDGDVHWRTLSRDNLLTIYGLDQRSRIADPLNASRIFSWLACEMRDDKGNALLYRYRAEDGEGIDVKHTCERNRGELDDPRRTANRYLKHIYYGNRLSLLNGNGSRPYFLDDEKVERWITDGNWMFELVFDYGEHDDEVPTPKDEGKWSQRHDSFSSYRAGFEVRTSRLCRRVLMFHHFEGEEGIGKNCLVRSTDLTYSSGKDAATTDGPSYTCLLSVSQSGYRRDNDRYLRRILPALTFEYSQPTVQDILHTVQADGAGMQSLGVGGVVSSLTDLHGEGLPGILAEQAGAWHYRRNLSPLKYPLDVATDQARFGPPELVLLKPNLPLGASRDTNAQFMDLAGDGQPDLVVLDGALPGLYEHDEEEGWLPFKPFLARLNRNMRDPNLRLVDLDGDGHADVLITESDAFVWHASLSEKGFGPAQRTVQALDEEKGPRLVFSDSEEAIYLADMSGDGLADLLRVRNGEVCYWPNLGYGRFGTKVTMDRPENLANGAVSSQMYYARHFDHPDQFDQQRIRLADIDGSGTTDIIYLHRDGVRLYFNRSGNSLSEPRILQAFPRLDQFSNVMTADLLGNGTACLMWSSPLPHDASQPLRYLNLIGKEKPHLLTRIINHLGAETRIRYAPSTQFYLQDKRDGKPWLGRLPFPVQLVERVESYDRVSGNRFVTRYAYHHGYFDGEEREFRGFGMVEQWDTDEIGNVPDNQEDSLSSNLDLASYVPPVHTKTWFDTGVFLGGLDYARQYENEYFREPALTQEAARQRMPPAGPMPGGLDGVERLEARRALKGKLLRQELYALDGSGNKEYPSGYPFKVLQQSFTVRCEQPKAGNRHAVFLAIARETIALQYERNPEDPRTQHTLMLETDRYGNVLKEAAIAYGRRRDAMDTALTALDRKKQRYIYMSCVLSTFTAAVDDHNDAYRAPLPAHTQTYEMRRPEQEVSSNEVVTPYAFNKVAEWVAQASDGNHDVDATDWLFDQARQAMAADPNKATKYFRRLLQCNRVRYRKDDLSGLLPLGALEPLALPGESYVLAITPDMVAQIFQRDGQALLPSPATVLSGAAQDQGAYQDLDNDGRWWIPSGQHFYSPGEADTAQQERSHAIAHFFLPHRYLDPFGQVSLITYDSSATPEKNHRLLLVSTRDPLGNTVTAVNDYRTLQPAVVTDANGNRSQVRFDAFGLVTGTAVLGKTGSLEGDSFSTFTDDLEEIQIQAYVDADDPAPLAAALLGSATTRVLYDFGRIPACIASIVRETHVSDLDQNAGSRLQLSFSHFDGLGREIQKKIQAEAGPVPRRHADGKIITGNAGQPLMTPAASSPRWVGSGWVIFNNKGKPVRRFEPFFSDTHRYDEDARIGTSPWLFYDPLDRIAATLHSDHRWEKIVYAAWEQSSHDVNDTVLNQDGSTDPKNDPHAGKYFRHLPDQEYLPSWQGLRTDPVHAAVFALQFPDAADRVNESSAARKTAAHAGTPAVVHLDSLGRPFASIAHNKVTAQGHGFDGTEARLVRRIELDIEGRQRLVRDPVTAVQGGAQAEGRLVMRYAYDLTGRRLKQDSMDAGSRWVLNDILGQPIRMWDSRGFQRRMTYDALRRPLGLYVSSEDVDEILATAMEYGENVPDAQATNHRGRIWKFRDGAGLVVSLAYDYKGNLLRSQRELLTDYAQTADWLQHPALGGDTFVNVTSYDALNRPTALTTPDGSVYQSQYNDAGLLERILVNVRGQSDAQGRRVLTEFVKNIDYGPKGERRRIAYANGMETVYDYDALTFRLRRMKTTRPAAADDLAVLFRDASVIQDLRFTYDPVGHIVRVEDVALKTIIYGQQHAAPVSEYTYDALYRLIEARGREHIGQTAWEFAPQAGMRRDFPLAGLRVHPNDLQALRPYIERYEYDAASNFSAMRHAADNGNWTRSYAYAEDSLLEPGRFGNRLSRTEVGNGNVYQEAYDYQDQAGRDAHGCMTGMNGLLMQWDYDDRLHQVGLGGGTSIWHAYDIGGERVRKVVLRPNGTRQAERVYLGRFERYREYAGDGQTVTLERETLHITDDRQRIALVETKTAPVPGSSTIRYQVGNQLGSSSLELDANAQLLTHEEYHPYGTTSFQATGAAEVSMKRYRYTAKERDEETGLYYHGARYYAAWLGRWTSCDPVTDEVNLYVYVRANPVNLLDPDGRAPVVSPLPGGPPGGPPAGLLAERGLEQMAAEEVERRVVEETAARGAQSVSTRAAVTTATTANGSVATGASVVGVAEVALPLLIVAVTAVAIYSIVTLDRSPATGRPFESLTSFQCDVARCHSQGRSTQSTLQFPTDLTSQLKGTIGWIPLDQGPAAFPTTQSHTNETRGESPAGVTRAPATQDTLLKQMVFTTVRSAFRDWARRVILENSKDPNNQHPLRFLLDAKGNWISSDKLHPLGIQAGHTTSGWLVRLTGETERLAIEGAWENQWDQKAEANRKAAFEKDTVLIGGIPVERRTARRFIEQGQLSQKDYDAAKGFTHKGWSK
jgi:RHS repeat-associated protein